MTNLEIWEYCCNHTPIQLYERLQEANKELKTLDADTPISNELHVWFRTSRVFLSYDILGLDTKSLVGNFNGKAYEKGTQAFYKIWSPNFSTEDYSIFTDNSVPFNTHKIVRRIFANCIPILSESLLVNKPDELSSVSCFCILALLSDNGLSIDELNSYLSLGLDNRDLQNILIAHLLASDINKSTRRQALYEMLSYMHLLDFLTILENVFN